MPISNPNKQLLIRALQSARNKGDELEIELLLQGRSAEAKQVRESNERLSKRIRKLISAAKKTWRGHAATLQQDMRKRNAALQGCIRDIRKSIGIAQNVVKAVGLIDDAAALAAKVMAPI